MDPRSVEIANSMYTSGQVPVDCIALRHEGRNRPSRVFSKRIWLVDRIEPKLNYSIPAQGPQLRRNSVRIPASPTYTRSRPTAHHL
ncbi:hypothetical protein RvY_13824 [Ramazzottius varieornatus]|uniref:Uncharacterized protein n=1 Tax=Ramazzottius varieornatus TaxID=947166 RepID=A0A1D1VP93_RAMVA|nr:hypothetical protein RvY_13824 [Ramazzottius varieornatus]